MKPLEEMSVAELEEMKVLADKLAAEKRDGEKKELQGKINQLIEDSPFTHKEILTGLSTKPRKSVPPKYCNPDNESETWTGRGRKPAWVTTYLEAGNDLEDCLMARVAETKGKAEENVEPEATE